VNEWIHALVGGGQVDGWMVTWLGGWMDRKTGGADY
jgi:hypothetical protein